MAKLHISRTAYYKSRNGYSGELYGKSSMSIYDPSGKEIMRTCNRRVNTLGELEKVVDEIPKLIKTLAEQLEYL